MITYIEISMTLGLIKVCFGAYKSQTTSFGSLKKKKTFKGVITTRGSPLPGMIKITDFFTASLSTLRTLGIHWAFRLLLDTLDLQIYVRYIENLGNFTYIEPPTRPWPKAKNSLAKGQTSLAKGKQKCLWQRPKPSAGARIKPTQQSVVHTVPYSCKYCVMLV